MNSIVTITPNPAIDICTTVDAVVPIRKLRCTTARRDAGGGGINVARVVRRLGGEVCAVYPAGGATGELLRRLVEREGVRNVAIPVAEETREDFTVVESRSGGQYRFVLPGTPLTENEWMACLGALVALNPAPAYLVCSGSLLPGVPDDFYVRAARIAKANGARVILDTSGGALATALDENVFLVKPNLRELQELAKAELPDELSQIGAAREIIRTGRTGIVALTLAERGALLITPDEVHRAQPVDVKLVSGVGAGDSFVGGLVWALANGSEYGDAFRWAVAAGSAAVMNPGTELCHAQDVKRLYGRIRVESV